MAFAFATMFSSSRTATVVSYFYVFGQALIARFLVDQYARHTR